MKLKFQLHRRGLCSPRLSPLHSPYTLWPLFFCSWYVNEGASAWLALLSLLPLLLLLLSSCRGCCCCSKWLRGIECIETEAVPAWRVEEREVSEGGERGQQGWHTSAGSPGWTRELARGGQAATAGYEMRILAQFATHSNSCTHTANSYSYYSMG